MENAFNPVKWKPTGGTPMLTGKTVVLAITGSIAAYKIANLARMLKNCMQMYRF